MNEAVRKAGHREQADFEWKSDICTSFIHRRSDVNLSREVFAVEKKQQIYEIMYPIYFVVLP